MPCQLFLHVQPFIDSCIFRDTSFDGDKLDTPFQTSNPFAGGFVECRLNASSNKLQAWGSPHHSQTSHDKIRITFLGIIIIFLSRKINNFHFYRLITTIIKTIVILMNTLLFQFETCIHFIILKKKFEKKCQMLLLHREFSPHFLST